MGLENFVPELWSDRLFVALRKTLVFNGLVNKDYEGQIRNYGDTVHINEIGPVTVNSYAKHGTLTYETLDSAQKTLLIDQISSFSFKIDDIDKAQTNPKLMDGAMNDAAYRIADTIDAFIAGLYAGAGVTGSATYIGSAASSVSVSSGNVIETITYAGRYLSEKNVPQENRWCAIPPWLHQKILLAEIGGVSATAVPKVFDDGTLVNGFIGQALGFNLVVSNNVSNNGTQYRVMCGNRSAISFAGQVTTVEALRLETTFADAVRGLYVYGAKVVNPDALCTMYLAEAAG
jgi:hypothetical protein